MKITTFAVAAALCATAGSISAASVELVAKESVAGDVRVECADAGTWKFSLSEERDPYGASVVTVRLASETPARPPRFTVSFTSSGVGADHVWTPYDDRYGIQPKEWGMTRHSSQLAFREPIAVAFRDDGRSVLALSCSEALRRLDYGLTIGSSDCLLYGRLDFFNEDEPPISSYETKIRIAADAMAWHDAVRRASAWIAATAGLEPRPVPDAARDALYSTWYAFWQDVHADELEREAALAASLGMKSMILDDGWQKEDSLSTYSATGDWLPVASRFPDMKRHVANVHAAGIENYMIWIAVPFVGDESAAWGRFKDKLLNPGSKDVGVMDPRFPEVREHVASICERAVGEWGFDGLKLDFIDMFKVPSEGDPAEKDDYAGRDIRSVPVAVDVLMKEVSRRVEALRPGALIEFRQQYMGPAIRQYGNMIRATDCPADSDKIRKLVCDLRLTSGETAVHSDMLVWHPGETPERAARPILNSLFSTIQYSMVLARTPEAHREVIRHWIKFSDEHRDALQRGAFRPAHPELNFPLIEGEGAADRVTAVYARGIVVDAPGGKPHFVVNAADAAGVVVDLREAADAEVRDVFGRVVGAERLEPGLRRVAVPPSGYLRLR